VAGAFAAAAFNMQLTTRHICMSDKSGSVTLPDLGQDHVTQISNANLRCQPGPFWHEVRKPFITRVLITQSGMAYFQCRAPIVFCPGRVSHAVSAKLTHMPAKPLPSWDSPLSIAVD
jgi:hypothetical protein